MRYLILALCLLPLVALADINTAVMTSGNQTVNGVKTFSQPIAGSVTGNAGTLGGHDSTYFQPAATAITTGNIGAQSVDYAATAGDAPDLTGRAVFQSYTSLPRAATTVQNTWAAFQNFSGGVKASDVLAKGPWVDVRYSGLTASAAYAAANSKPLYITEWVDITSNTDLSGLPEIDVLQGGGFNVSSGVTLTLPPNFRAGLTRVFSGTGSVIGLSVARPEWWKDPAASYYDDALASASNAAKTVLLSQADYPISAVWDTRTSTVKVVTGQGRASTSVTQYTDNVPIIQVAGEAVHITGIKFRYNSVQPSSNTSANGIEIYKLYESTIEKCSVLNAARGVYLPQVDYGGAGTGNYIYSVAFRDMRINAFSIYGMALENYTAGGTGCVFENIYFNNFIGGVRTAATTAFRLANFSEGEASQINIEHGKYSSGIHLNNVENFVMDGVHVEGYEANLDNYGIINMPGSNGKVSVNGLTLVFSYFQTATRYSTLLMASGNMATINGYEERDNTVTVPSFPILSGTATTGSVKIVNTSYTGHTAVYAGMATSPPAVLQQYNNSFYQYQVGTMTIDSGTAPPTTGAHTIGDIRWNTDTSITRYSFWKCVASGTPGTWKGGGWLPPKGNTASRPSYLGANDAGVTYLDTDLDSDGQLIIWNGSGWFNTLGAGPVNQTTTNFAGLGSVPAAGVWRYCTDCTTAATCAGSGTGHMAVSNGTNWTCQ